MILTVTLNVSVDKLYILDDFNIGSVMRVKECCYTAGGKGINVTKVIKLLGEEVCATGFIGGYAGEYIRENIKEAGISEKFLKVEGESRSCINIYDETTGKHTELLEPGMYIKNQDMDKFIQRFNSLCEECEVVTISGSIPRGVDKTIYQKMIEYAKGKGKKVILDTSGEALTLGIQALPTVIKPNVDELKQIVGTEIISKTDLIAAAKQLYNNGIRIAIISLGKNGAIIVCKDGIYQGITPDIKVVNTVGCGDSMVAGFAVGLSRGYKMIDTIKLAMAVSTANALTKETGFYIKEDLLRLYNEIDVIRLGETID